MAQDGTTAGGASYTIDNVTFPVGRTKLQSIFNAIRSTNKGSSAPDLVAGQFWVDDTNDPTWTLYFYDGSDSIQFCTINTTDNTVNFIDSTFTQLTSDLSTNGNDINFGDNDKANFGASNDLQIYHDGSNSNIFDGGTGGLDIRGHSNIWLRSYNTGETFLDCTTNGAVQIYYDGSKKLATTSSGIDVTGTVVSDGLTVDTNTLYVDSTNNRVGVGTTSPSTVFHIKDSVARITLEDSDVTNAICDISGGGAGNLTVRADPNNLVASSYIGLAVDGATQLNITSSETVINDGSADHDFRVESNNNTHALFVEGSSGNVLLGISALADYATTASHTFQNDGLSTTTRDGGLTSIFNRLTSDGDIVHFRKDNTTVGSIGNIGNYLTIGSDDTGLAFAENVDSIIPHNLSTNTYRDNGVDLGASTVRFKDFYLTGTVTNDGSGGMSIDTSGNVKFNDGGIDANFRVESNNNTHMLFVDGGTDKVSIGSSGITTNVKFDVTGRALIRGQYNNPNGTLSLESDADGNVGAILDFYQDSNSPASNDQIGYLRFFANDSASNKTEYATVIVDATDVTNGAEDGRIRIKTIDNGTNKEKIRINPQNIVFNEDGNDYDFRVESNNESHMFFVDGGNDNIGIKTNTPDTTVDLDIQGNMQVGDTGSLQMLVGKSIADDYNWGNDGTGANGRAFSLISDQGSLVQALYFGDVSNASSAIFSISSGTGGTFTNRFRVDCDGDVTIAGALSKGSGSFKIDHPLPEKTDTHHLIHSFVEAPQADNIYRGKVDLVNGTATVNIDMVARMSEGTFVLLNREIQCFTSNETGWTAVKGSVSDNILTITAQDKTCTDTISWLVIGERQDQHMYDTGWTDENGKVMVEPLKQIKEQTNGDNNNLESS